MASDLFQSFIAAFHLVPDLSLNLDLALGLNPSRQGLACFRPGYLVMDRPVTADLGHLELVDLNHLD